MGDYLDNQFKTLKAIKDVSGTSSLGARELFRIFVEMRHGAYLINTETAEATDNDLFKADTDATDDTDDTDKEPRKVTFQLAGLDMCAPGDSGDDGCDLDDNGRIVNDLA